MDQDRSAQGGADLAHALTSCLSEVPARPVSVPVDSLRRLSGGASRETWSFIVSGVDPGAGVGGQVDLFARDERRLILQRVRPGLAMGGPSLAVEDRLLASAARAGVPVPAVVADSATCSPLLGEARITEHVDGETLGPRIVRDDRFAPARSVLAGQCAQALAAIHSIDPAEVDGLQPVDTLGRLRDGLDLLGEARPAFELTLRWLHDHQPPARPPAVVHGDFRIGNLIVDDDGLAAVLDWELAHLGDPLEDLGWLCVRAWRFGGLGDVGGFAPLEDLLTVYADATGSPVDADHVRWWIVAGTLTWGLICAVQARRHLDGHVQSVELATIGRRVCETEYDLLHLLGVPVPSASHGRNYLKSNGLNGNDLDRNDKNGTDKDADGATWSSDDAGLHGRPTTTELIDAVRSHLTEHVQPTLEGSAAFTVRVAANALSIVERELRLGPRIAADATEGLASLGFADETDVAAAVRAGHVGIDQSEVTAVIRAIVVGRVRVANPKWLLPEDRTSGE